MSRESALRFWRAMSFPTIADLDQKLFTEYDVDVMRAHKDMIVNDKISEDALSSLIRGQSHLADRLVLWQYEALVDDLETRHNLDPISARYLVLDRIEEFEEFLVYQMKYAWRRHLSAFLRRSEVELEGMDYSVADGATLQRALGFVDLVAFTDRSNQMAPPQLVDFIQTFEYAARDVITTKGARVVKTLGDAVLYVADDVSTGAEVVTEIVHALKSIPGMPDVRASLVWDKVVSRFGDIFGPAVNRASRLAGVGEPGQVLLDAPTARAVANLPGGKWTVTRGDSHDLQGLGWTETFELRPYEG